MDKNRKQILLLFALVLVLLLPYIVFGQSPLERMQGVAEQGGFAPATETSLAQTTGMVISAFFSILGVVFLVLILTAGFNWMTAAGDKAKLEKAGDTIRRAIIGLIITIGSWAIYNFIFIKLIFAG